MWHATAPTCSTGLCQDAEIIFWEEAGGKHSIWDKIVCSVCVCVWELISLCLHVCASLISWWLTRENKPKEADLCICTLLSVLLSPSMSSSPENLRFLQPLNEVHSGVNSSSCRACLAVEPKEFWALQTQSQLTLLLLSFRVLMQKD